MQVEPGRRRYFFERAIGGRYLDLGQPSIDAGAGPRLATRQKEVSAAGGVAYKVVQHDALLGQVVVRLRQARVEAGSDGRLDCPAALVGDIPVSLHGSVQGVL